MQDLSYSHQTNEDIYEWARLAQEEFSKSSQAKVLTGKALEKVYLISIFAELAYSYHLRKPGLWTDLEILDVCCHLIPQKLLASPETFEELPAIIDTFFLWGEEIGIFEKTHGWRQTLASHKNALLTNAQVPGNWELAKSLIMES